MAHPHSTLTSMTGFARSTGTWRALNWVWEIKSVNGKALDLRFRLPAGFDAVESAARLLAGTHVKRGNLQISLSISNTTETSPLQVNQVLLEQLVELAGQLRDRLGSPPIQAESLLAMRGVLDTETPALSEDDMKQRDAAVNASFDVAMTALSQARREEGARLGEVLKAQLDRISELTEAARRNPSRSVEVIQKRLAEQVEKLLGQSDAFDPQRLHQEAVVLATRVDIQEEIDRLTSHIAAAQALMAAREPVGRKFDFLLQEFNREANTLCSKANEPSLTAIGLDLKTVIDQLREQVQNIE